MRIADFALERYFARWEFAVEHLLCASDVQGFPMAELLAPGRRRDARPVGRPDPRLHRVDRPPAAARARSPQLYDGVEPDDVLVFAGAEEAIFCLMNALLGPGDHAVVHVARATRACTRSAGRPARTSRSTSSTRTTAGRSTSTRLLGALTAATRLVVVNAPHNPTGMLPTGRGMGAPDRLRCRTRGIHLLADEVYRFLEFDEARSAGRGRRRATSVACRSASCRSRSRWPGCGSAGWPPATATCWPLRGRFKDYTTICSSAPSEILALIGLRARDRVLARSRGIVAANLERLDEFFADWADRFTWVRPRGGSIGFPRLTVPGVRSTTGRPSSSRPRACCSLPASLFGHPGNHFRLGFGRTDLPEALGLLEGYAARTLR